jgi:predicted naringenin-chalcone synthase
MGCAAGVSGIIYAQQLLKSNPGKTAAVVSVESPTSTFQHNDFSMTNMVSAAIFGDGAACVLLQSGSESGLQILDTNMYHFYNQERLMGFDLCDTGLKMVLDPSVPEKIEENLPEILNPFLAKNELSLNEIDHFVFHPGGKRIVQIVEESITPMGKNIDKTREVLRNFGNMSSATILYVLEEFMNDSVSNGQHGLMLSFGPGFSAQQVLLKWT